MANLKLPEVSDASTTSPAGKMFLLLSALLLFSLVMAGLLAYMSRKKRKRRHRHSRSSDSSEQSTSEDGGTHRRHHRRRHRSDDHGLNPTRAQAGGLPPKRAPGEVPFIPIEPQTPPPSGSTPLSHLPES
jgi:hypothetical protein